jgi:hypothetical protein
MTGQDLLDYTRKYLLRDKNTPPLFPDELLVRYLDEGQQRLVERTHSYVEADRTVEITTGETLYPLDDDIAFVYQVRLDGFYNNLIDVTESWTPTDTGLMRPNRFITDTATQSIRFYPAPDMDYTAILRVAKLPAAITLDNLDDELELKERYQLIIADWAAYRCWGNDDVDGRNDGAAVNALAKFNMGMNEVKRNEYRQRTGHLQRVHGDRVK